MKGNELTKVFTYNKNNQPIRVEMINDEAWFAAKDVCKVLGMTNSRRAVGALDNDEKRGVRFSYPLG